MKSFTHAEAAPLLFTTKTGANVELVDDFVASTDDVRLDDLDASSQMGRSYEQLWYGRRAAIKWRGVGLRVKLVRRAGIGLFLVREDAS